MPYTVSTVPIVPPSPVRLVAQAHHPRAVEITNSGPAPVWVGHDDVVPNRGRQLLPGDDGYVYADLDELYAVCWSTSTVVVVERS